MLHIQCIHFWVEYICLWSFSEILPLLLAKGKDLSLLLFLGKFCLVNHFSLSSSLNLKYSGRVGPRILLLRFTSGSVVR